MAESSDGATVSTDAMRIDVRTNTVVETSVAAGSFRPAISGNAGVWFLGGPEEPSGLCHLSGTSLQVDVCVDAGAPADPSFDPVLALDPVGQAMWVANFTETVTRVSLASSAGVS
jgi:hypothetical protein